MTQQPVRSLKFIEQWIKYPEEIKKIRRLILDFGVVQSGMYQGNTLSGRNSSCRCRNSLCHKRICHRTPMTVLRQSVTLI